MEKDIVIIGGGPGGYSAAIRAAQFGADVLLIEAESLGGTCLNKGCIPTKALYKNAQMINEINNAAEFGIKIDGFTIDMDEVMKRKQKIVDTLKDGVLKLIQANSIETINGKASLASSKMIKVIDSKGKESMIKSKNIIIATGSSCSKPLINGIDLPEVMTSDEILLCQRVPKSLTIIGGGAIGIEFASVFNAFGSKVTVVEFLPKVLENMDSEISKKLALSLKKKGIGVETEARVIEIIKTKDSLSIVTNGKKGETLISSEAVLIATGRAPNVDELNLESLGIAYDKKGVKVDENLQTNIPGIYAIGDVIGGQMLAHVASEEGIMAVDNIMGLKKQINYYAIPSCVFTFPEIAAVGLSEEEAKNKGIEYCSSKFLFGGNGKALSIGEGEGFIKVLASAQDKNIIGVHIMGPHASDLISEAVLAVKNKMTVSDISSVVHAHPTLSEAFKEAVMGIENRAIHVVPSKKGTRKS